jgi:uncharacterized protein YecE (DUF72 family)
MIRIGTCGFSFRDWKGTAYPANLPGRDMLRYYEKNLGLDTVEIDASFYAIPYAKTVQGCSRYYPDPGLYPEGGTYSRKTNYLMIGIRALYCKM